MILIEVIELVVNENVSGEIDRKFEHGITRVAVNSGVPVASGCQLGIRVRGLTVIVVIIGDLNLLDCVREDIEHDSKTEEDHSEYSKGNHG